VALLFNTDADANDQVFCELVHLVVERERHPISTGRGIRTPTAAPYIYLFEAIAHIDLAGYSMNLWHFLVGFLVQISESQLTNNVSKAIPGATVTYKKVSLPQSASVAGD
jgi:hypothetical protein